MTYLKTYLNQLSTRRQARRWLSASDPARLAADCMFRLNRRAFWTGSDNTRWGIYQLKNKLVKHFHQAGYCVNVTLQEQVQKCWHTWDYNHGLDDYCEKCGNTGIYQRTTLYRFVFVIGGRRYIWHQPGDLVSWSVDVAVPFEVGEYQAGERRKSGLNAETTMLYMAVVYEYLLSQGVEIKPPYPWGMRLIGVIWADLWRLWYDLTVNNEHARRFRRWQTDTRYRLREYRRNLARLVTFLKTGELPAATEPAWMEEDEIPF